MESILNKYSMYNHLCMVATPVYQRDSDALNKKHWKFLRDCIDFNIIELKEDSKEKVCYTIDNLCKMGYYCIAYDVLQANKDMYKDLSKQTMYQIKWLKKEIDNGSEDMNIKAIYDFFK